MAQLLHLLTLLLISAVIIVESSSASTFDVGWGLSHFTGVTRGARTCNGVDGGCIGEDVEDEFVVGLEGEDVRRSLGGRPRLILIGGVALKSQGAIGEEEDYEEAALEDIFGYVNGAE
ncbi:hypothetical protein Sjap_025732 [Stephania japonica]|uniref:Uncharacterized protein n=1 Tax=Stephania japonica TaxID=461633 RepID=A0AAP0HI84_9MAGN